MHNSIMALSALFISGMACASQPTPRPMALDPSNPSAQEAPAAALTPLVGGQAAPEEGPASRVTEMYTCPMHPEISSPKAGRCPKCGMNLVPRQPDAASPVEK